VTNLTIQIPDAAVDRVLAALGAQQSSILGGTPPPDASAPAAQKAAFVRAQIAKWLLDTVRAYEASQAGATASAAQAAKVDQQVTIT
jgi:hypothetical protein